MITEPAFSCRHLLQPTLIGYHEAVGLSSGKVRVTQGQAPRPTFTVFRKVRGPQGARKVILGSLTDDGQARDALKVPAIVGD